MEPKKKPQVVRGTVEEINAFRKREAAKIRKKMGEYDWFPRRIAYFCDDRNNRCCGLVLLYAKLGLHRYNILEGKNLQLSSVKSYDMNSGAIALRNYSIYLEAKDPANDPGTLQTFEVGVAEQKFNSLVLKCFVPLIRGETKKIRRGSGLPYNSLPFMPELPPENPFKDDTSRFYVLEESELQDNDHWIRLYVELAVATTSRSSKIKHALTNLMILKVAMESTPYLSQGLGARDATFYIRYEDSCEARVGKDVDRVAIVRRVWDEQAAMFSLVGRQHSSHTIIPSNMIMEPASSSSSAQD